MMLLESVPKEPLSFEIIRFDNQKITYTFLVSSKKKKRTLLAKIKSTGIWISLKAEELK